MFANLGLLFLNLCLCNIFHFGFPLTDFCNYILIRFLELGKNLYLLNWYYQNLQSHLMVIFMVPMSLEKHLLWNLISFILLNLFKIWLHEIHLDKSLKFICYFQFLWHLKYLNLKILVVCKMHIKWELPCKSTNFDNLPGQKFELIWSCCI